MQAWLGHAERHERHSSAGVKALLASIVSSLRMGETQNYMHELEHWREHLNMTASHEQPAQGRRASAATRLVPLTANPGGVLARAYDRQQRAEAQAELAQARGASAASSAQRGWSSAKRRGAAKGRESNVDIVGWLKDAEEEEARVAAQQAAEVEQSVSQGQSGGLRHDPPWQAAKAAWLKQNQHREDLD